MAKFKVSVSDECIGCGACVAVCDNFRMVDGKSRPVKEIVEEEGCNVEAAAGCPVGAIVVEKL